MVLFVPMQMKEVACSRGSPQYLFWTFIIRWESVDERGRLFCTGPSSFKERDVDKMGHPYIFYRSLILRMEACRSKGFTMRVSLLFELNP